MQQRLYKRMSVSPGLAKNYFSKNPPIPKEMMENSDMQRSNTIMIKNKFASMLSE